LMKIQKAQWDFLQKLNHGTLNDISCTFDSLQYIKKLSLGLGGWIQPPRPKIPANPQKSGTKDLAESNENRGMLRHLFLLSNETCAQSIGGYFIWSCSVQKNPFVSPNLSPACLNRSCKIRTKTGKTGNWKNEAEIQLIFPQLVAPVKHLEEFFVL